MTWKECNIMDERLKFIARVLEWEKIAPLCCEFGIARKTGHKIYKRYKDMVLKAFKTVIAEPIARQVNFHTR